MHVLLPRFHRTVSHKIISACRQWRYSGAETESSATISSTWPPVAAKDLIALSVGMYDVESRGSKSRIAKLINVIHHSHPILPCDPVSEEHIPVTV